MTKETADRDDGLTQGPTGRRGRGRPPGSSAPLLSAVEETRILELYDGGRTPNQIAAAVGVSGRTVYNVIKRSIRRFMAEQDALVSQIINKKLRILDYTVSELTEAWRRSTQAPPAVRRTTKRTVDPDGGVTTETTTAEDAEPCYGDVSYLVELRHHLAEMSKLVGADAPARTESRAQASHSVVVSRGPDVGSMSDDEIRALVAVGEEIQRLNQQPVRPAAGGESGPADGGPPGEGS